MIVNDVKRVIENPDSFRSFVKKSFSKSFSNTVSSSNCVYSSDCSMQCGNKRKMGCSAISQITNAMLHMPLKATLFLL